MIALSKSIDHGIQRTGSKVIQDQLQNNSASFFDLKGLVRYLIAAFDC
jgi:hypothetical protein